MPIASFGKCFNRSDSVNARAEFEQTPVRSETRVRMRCVVPVAATSLSLVARAVGAFFRAWEGGGEVIGEEGGAAAQLWKGGAGVGARGREVDVFVLFVAARLATLSPDFHVLGCCPRVEAITCSRIPSRGKFPHLEGGRLHPKNRDLFWSEWLPRSCRISSVRLQSASRRPPSELSVLGPRFVQR